MTKKTAYSYTLLRYVHDPISGEFVNVGVVLFAPSNGIVRYEFRKTIGRLKNVFPDIDAKAFKDSMRAAQSGLKSVAKQESETDLFRGNGDALAVAKRSVPIDDSCLQWSPVGSGITSDCDATFNLLYKRYVSYYDIHQHNRRSDDDIWRPVRKKLEEHNLDKYLQEKSIQGNLDDISFRHAWKNGRWHVYEPLSFDLADAEGIKAKAREWLGHLSAVINGGVSEEIKPHFVVGAPSSPALNDAYKSALAILRQAPNDPVVYEEDHIDQLIAKMEDEIRAHNEAMF